MCDSVCSFARIEPPCDTPPSVLHEVVSYAVRRRTEKEREG